MMPHRPLHSNQPKKCGDIGDNGDNRMDAGFAASPAMGTVWGHRGQSLGTSGMLNHQRNDVSPRVPSTHGQVGTAETRMDSGCPHCPHCPHKKSMATKRSAQTGARHPETEQ